ncbi:response regulator, partial [Sphingomonas sp. NPDC019816]|uniref:response regulator n=1 Tax=Sphingomonas sp. NPDC019816 TaxID=3390679 RepID=UPI003CFBE0AF
MRVLIVEDEPNLGQQLKTTLEGAGYAIDLATDGEEGHFLGSTENYDAIVLDLGLPEIDGLTVLDRWRKEGKTMPVLVLTARDSWSDKVAGLDAGADDYVAKPFSPREVSARVRTILRRLHKQQRLQQSARYHFGAFTLDEDAATISYHQRPLPLTRYEYLLLKTLVLAPGRVFSRQQLMESVWKKKK